MNTSLIQSLGARLAAVILPLVNRVPERICILDVPDYPNVGDPAILLGELKFFRNHFPNARMTLVSHRQYSETVDREIEAADILFLHGGGSFGDIWPAHHSFRLKMLSKFSHRDIIQLPQSLHFTDKYSLEETKHSISKVKRFELIVRDQKAYDFASQNFDCDVHLAPDMAFALGPLVAAEAAVDLLCLMRTDKESVTDSSRKIIEVIENSGQSFEIVDWMQNRQNIERIHDLTRKLSKYGLSRRLIARHGISLYEAYATSRLRFGVALLSRGKTVVTDRLHGHIISTLLNKDQLVLDSLDGKVRLFNQTWLSKFGKARFVSGPEELGDLLQSKLRDAA